MKVRVPFEKREEVRKWLQTNVGPVNRKQDSLKLIEEGEGWSITWIIAYNKDNRASKSSLSVEIKDEWIDEHTKMLFALKWA